jgi:hypothetical protein
MPAVATEAFEVDEATSVAVVACGVPLPVVVYVNVTDPVGAPTEDATVAVSTMG